MGNTFVHGYVVSEQRARGLVRALRGAGFPGRDIEFAREVPSGKPLEQPGLRRNALRDVKIGAVLGAVAVAPLGPVVQGMASQPGAPARLWVLVSETPLGATMELGVLGALAGALMGVAVGIYRARQAAARDARYFVGVHAADATRKRALDTMQEMGSSELVAEDE